MTTLATTPHRVPERRAADSLRGKATRNAAIPRYAGAEDGRFRKTPFTT
jgi:hypothetical protein